MRLGLGMFLIVAMLSSFAGCAKDTSMTTSADDAARDARRQAALADCEKQKGNETYISCKKAAQQVP